MMQYIVHSGNLKGRIEGITCLQRAEELAFQYGAEVWLEEWIDGVRYSSHIATMRSI